MQFGIYRTGGVGQGAWGVRAHIGAHPGPNIFIRMHVVAVGGGVAVRTQAHTGGKCFRMH